MKARLAVRSRQASEKTAKIGHKRVIGTMWKAVRLMMAIAALTLCVPMLVSQESAVQEVFRRGALAMRNGRTADAEEEFRRAVKLAPGLPEAHLDLGLVLGRQGKLDEAIASVQDALRLDPKLDSAHMFLGIFLYQANRREEAKAALRQEIAQSPENVEALKWLGTVELAMNQPDQAASAFDHAHDLAPKDLEVLEYRGKAHSQVARDSYAAMAMIDPASWHVHRVRAELFATEGRHADAIAEYEAAVQSQSRNPDLYEALGDEYRAANQLDSAQKAYATELGLSPQNQIAMYDLGSTDIELGKDADGVSLLRTMLKTYRAVPVAEYYLGRGLAAEGSEVEAVEWLEKSAANDPSGEVGKRSFYELARVYRKLQRPDDAARALAEYTRRREQQEKKNAQQIQDWRKLDAAPVAGQANAAP